MTTSPPGLHHVLDVPMMYLMGSALDSLWLVEEPDPSTPDRICVQHIDMPVCKPSPRHTHLMTMHTVCSWHSYNLKYSVIIMCNVTYNIIPKHIWIHSSTSCDFPLCHLDVQQYNHQLVFTNWHFSNNSTPKNNPVQLSPIIGKPIYNQTRARFNGLAHSTMSYISNECD